MRKELIISSISQETRVAVVEDGELVELLIERRRSQGIAGNIYKGRVMKVLPGMQSAFVDIGLERDAFLYVSDFLEDTDEYERIVSTAEDEALKDGDSSRGNVRGKARPDREPDREKNRPRAKDRDGRDKDRDRNREQVRGEPKKEPDADRQSPGRREPDTEPVAVSGEKSPARESRSRDRRPDRDQDSEGRRPSGRGPGDGRGPRPRVSSSESTTDTGSTAKSVSRPRSVLPGESLAKYRDSTPPTAIVSPEAAIVTPEASTRDVRTENEGARQSPDEEVEVRAEVDGELRVESGSETVVETDIEEVVDSADESTVDPESEISIEAESPEPEAVADPEAAQGEASDPDTSVDGDETPEDGGSGDAAPTSDPESAEDEGLIEGETRRARIIDRGTDGKFTRKAPSRRPRRRSSGKSDSGDRPDRSSKTPSISELLKEGQEILVQVSKEPLGRKGARITSHIALPGRYIVYMPTVDHVGVSRKIESDEERSRLRKIISENREDLPGGFIVRTAAEGRDEKEFIQDMHFLFATWREIREKSDKAAAPALIHSDLGLVERVLRDQLSDEYKAIRLDSEVEYTKVLDFVSKFQPSLVNRVKLHLKKTAIFEEYGLQQEIDKAMRSKVWLKSGGYIVVNQTEALVAIDVNTGKFVGRSNRLEDTIVRTNIDAVHEIVRQIRLRNLGGIIVVDFIDMEERKNRQRVMQALEEELERDRSPSKILQFNDFGLVAITRKRTQASLERILGTPCPRCQGAGYVKAIETVCYEIQQELKKMLDDVEGDEVTIRVSPEVAKALKSAEFVDFAELEEEFRKDIRVQGDPTLPAERFDVYE